MGREIKRVPLDFDWPYDTVWEGYLTPEKFHEDNCPAGCEGGHSWQYTRLNDLWYGKAPFDPAMTGSTPWTADSPVIRARAQRSISQDPYYYGTGETAVIRHSRYLANLFNKSWSNHLSQQDVDALVEGGRLWDFTRRVEPGKGWVDRETPMHPTAAQVNEWDITGFGHDAINAWTVIKARCERYGTPTTCPTCKGHGSMERYEGQREERDAWEPTEPPTGEGWQLWQTVSEGSPISLVYDNPEDLARWMASPNYRWGAHKGTGLSYEAALNFVMDGWAPSFIANASTGVVDGVKAVGEGLG